MIIIKKRIKHNATTRQCVILFHITFYSREKKLLKPSKRGIVSEWRTVYVFTSLRPFVHVYFWHERLGRTVRATR